MRSSCFFKTNEILSDRCCSELSRNLSNLKQRRQDIQNQIDLLLRIASSQWMRDDKDDVINTILSVLALCAKKKKLKQKAAYEIISSMVRVFPALECCVIMGSIDKANSLLILREYKLMVKRLDSSTKNVDSILPPLLRSFVKLIYQSKPPYSLPQLRASWRMLQQKSQLTMNLLDRMNAIVLSEKVFPATLYDIMDLRSLFVKVVSFWMHRHPDRAYGYMGAFHEFIQQGFCSEISENNLETNNGKQISEMLSSWCNEASLPKPACLVPMLESQSELMLTLTSNQKKSRQCQKYQVWLSNRLKHLVKRDTILESDYVSVMHYVHELSRYFPLRGSGDYKSCFAGLLKLLCYTSEDALDEADFVDLGLLDLLVWDEAGKLSLPDCIVNRICEVLSQVPRVKDSPRWPTWSAISAAYQREYFAAETLISSKENTHPFITRSASARLHLESRPLNNLTNLQL